MIEPLYKRNNDIDEEGIVYSKYRYDVIYKFLKTIHIIAPEVERDLYPIMQLVKDTVKKDGDGLYLPPWSELSKLDEQKYIILKNSIKEWALKYNLIDKNGFYINIALHAICDAINSETYNIDEDVDDVEKEINLQKKKILSKYDDMLVNLPEALIDGSIENDDEIYVLKKATGRNDRRCYYRLEWDFPFVFAPSAEYHIYGGSEEDILDNWEKPETYETPYIYDYMKSVLLYDYRMEKYRKYEYGDKIIKHMNKPSDELKMYADFYVEPWNESLNPIAWDPREETWDEFEKKIDELYKHYKEAYRKRTEEFFKKNGYVKGKEKYEDSHFEWFVRYQVQGWSKEKIAREYHVTRQSVTNAIDEIGDLVGLKPRPTSKGGRPKKG